MTIDGTQGSSSASRIQANNFEHGPSTALMGPEEIMAYVSNALGDIGDQLDSFKKQVEDKTKKAQELREIAGTLRLMNTGKDLQAFDEPAFNEMMTKMSHYVPADKDVTKAYEQFLVSYGGYDDTETGEPKGVKGGADGTWNGNGVGDTQDWCMNPSEVDKCIKDIEGAQSALGSENELTMMSLQQLMQRRNQITQFSSNCMNVMNEGMKSVIGNIR